MGRKKKYFFEKQCKIFRNWRNGRKLFNGFFGCSHCHGTNAITSKKKQDLRLLKVRHAEKAKQVFRTTVINGRPSKGMLTWGGIINEEQMAAIKSFLFSIQFNRGVKWRFKHVIGTTAKFFWNGNCRPAETRMGSP